MRVVWLFALLLCLGVATSPVVAQSKPKPSDCKFCKHKGGKPCKKHKKRDHEKEHRVQVCCHAMACKSCAGALWLDCKYCEDKKAQAVRAMRLEQGRRWLAKRRKVVDARLPGRKILHAKTEHVDLSFSIQPLKVGRRKLSTHDLMHAYVDRLTSLRADFMKVLELKDKDFTVPIDVFMFRQKRSHVALSPHVTGMDGRHGTGQILMGDHMVYCMAFDKQKMKGDLELHRNIVHMVTHLFINHMSPPVWIYNKKHGWLDAGLAHWFEYRVTKRCTNFCFEEVSVDPNEGYKGGKWRVALRKLVVAKQAPSLTTFYQKNTDQLSFEEHALSFGYVDYLLSAYPGAKMRDLLRAAKAKVPTIEALRKVYKQTPFQIDEGFRTFVRKTYPKR